MNEIISWAWFIYWCVMLLVAAGLIRTFGSYAGIQE